MNWFESLRFSSDIVEISLLIYLQNETDRETGVKFYIVNGPYTKGRWYCRLQIVGKVGCEFYMSVFATLTNCECRSFHWHSVTMPTHENDLTWISREVLNSVIWNYIVKKNHSKFHITRHQYVFLYFVCTMNNQAWDIRINTCRL